MDARDALTTDHLEQLLVRAETAVARARAAQLTVLGEIDRRQVATGDGCRSLAEWVAGRLDVAPETAAALVRAMHGLADRPALAAAVAEGEVTFDRAAALARSDDGDLARHLDISGIRRHTAAQRRVTRADERRAFSDRYLVIQPSLDEARWRLHGQLPGMAGRVVEKALHDRGDTFGDLPDGSSLSRGARNADALAAMAQDSLDRDDDRAVQSGRPHVTVFVDATDNPAYGAKGTEVEFGPRVGPDALETVLCTGSVAVVGLANGRPVTASGSVQAIPPAIRRFVAWRDGACTADGCSSRYRLEPHHVRRRIDGGGHDPDNLTMLCWFHHHVVVHGHGYRIDPESPTGRRRFLRPQSNGPP